MNDYEICKLVDAHEFEYSGCIDEVEYQIIYDGDVTYVLFRGTEVSRLITGNGWLDVVRDLRIIPWYDDRTGWCHAGFLKGARAVVEKDLMPILSKFIEYPIVFAGHSLGGALSLLAAKIMYEEGYQVQKWVGFGTPKTQWSDSAVMPFQCFNYRFGGDLVSKIPHFFYSHPVNANLIQLGVSDAPSLVDHEIENYISAMRLRTWD